MSLFDFPRINVKGIVTLNPGTANNDDYASDATLPDTFPPPYAGQPLALYDSKLSRARTYGMSDADFITWIQQVHTFNISGGKTKEYIPAEWNYYGNMSSEVGSGDATVIGVQTGPDKVYTAKDSNVPITSFIGSELTYSGGITDVNSEGSPPATQFFIDTLTLKNGTAIAIEGPASKGACQWINFYRNVNLTADSGAGGYVYHVILKSQCGGKFNIPGFEDPKIIGAIFRYYLYRVIKPVTEPHALEKLFRDKQQNQASLQFAGTIAPLYEGEAITTGPVGRLLVAPPPSIHTDPLTHNNGGGTIALGPAVLHQNEKHFSIDLIGTFPENYQPPTNDKYDFGWVSLVAENAAMRVTLPIRYQNTMEGDARGWLFDFDLNLYNKVLDDPFTFRLVTYTERLEEIKVLGESDYYIVSNQQAVYAEQNGARDSFVNQGTNEPATIRVYQHGRELSPSNCPPITVWRYSTVPLQTPGDRVKVAENFKPGDPLIVDTSQSGNFTYVFTIGNQQPPPRTYGEFLNPPFTTIMNTFQICVRILPNDEDFSQYYGDPSSPAPVGNDKLTFDIVFEKVLRTYYLLFPIMNEIIPLNDEAKVWARRNAILERTDPKLWMTEDYMPRTRDLSESRRKLLQAWCRKP